LVDIATAIEVLGDGAIAIGFLILYILSMRVVRAFSLGSLARLFNSVSVVLLLFAIREVVEIAFVVAPVLQQAELLFDLGMEIIFLVIVAFGVVPVVKIVRNLHSEGTTRTVSAAREETLSDGRVLADVLNSALTAIAGIMGPSVIYGVAARACLPILEKTGRASDKTWLETFLPIGLRPRLAPETETPPIEP
jgi:hypothetical protein